MENQLIFLFQIKPSSGVPIYKQLIEQINRLVVSGTLNPGDEIPSVRQTAAHLEVNPMTISKAYSLLEATGVLERVRGKGMIVASNQKGGRGLKERMEIIRPVLVEAAAQANQLALPKETILKEFIKLLEDKNE